MKDGALLGLVLAFLIACLPLGSAQLVENVVLPEVSSPSVSPNASSSALVAGGAGSGSEEVRISASLETGISRVGSEEDTGESISVHVESYEPKILVSSVLEDNDVPVFVFLKGSTLGSLLGIASNVEPLFASPEITQVTLKPLDAFTNEFVRGGIKYTRPDRLTLDNLGYLTVFLKQTQREEDIPNMINLSYTAEIYFTGVERLFNLIKTDLILPEDPSEDVWRTKTLTDYSFFAKRGFIRASSIGENSATFVVYSGEDLLPPFTGTPRPIDRFTIKKGETSPYIRMRAARGLPQNSFRVKLNDVVDGTTKRARLRVTLGAKTEEVSISEGSSLYPGSQWRVTKIESVKEGSGEDAPVREEVTIKSDSGETRKVVRRYTPTGSGAAEEDPCASLEILDDARSEPIEEPTEGDLDKGIVPSTPKLSTATDFEKGNVITSYDILLHDLVDNTLDLRSQEKYTGAESLPESDYLEVQAIDDKDQEKFELIFHKDYPSLDYPVELKKGETKELVGKENYYDVKLVDVSEAVKDLGFPVSLHVVVYERKEIAAPKKLTEFEAAVESSGVVGTIKPHVELTSLSSLDAKTETLSHTRDDVVLCTAIDEYKKVKENYPGIVDAEGVPLTALASFRIAEIYERLGFPKIAGKYYAESLTAGKGAHVAIATVKMTELEEDIEKNTRRTDAPIIDNGKDVRVSLRGITTGEDEASAVIDVQDQPERRLKVGDNLFVNHLVEQKGGKAYNYNWRITKISSKGVEVEKIIFLDSGKTEKPGVVGSILGGRRTLELRENELLDEKSVFVKEADAKKYVVISIVPGTGRPSVSVSNFSIHIPVEKRAIPLAPEKIPQKINKTEATIRQLDNVITKLDKVVSTWKKVCLVTFLALTVKNSFLTGTSRNIARNAVMRGVDGKSGWYNYCLKNSGKGKAYSSFDTCVARNLASINSELSAAQSAVDKVNREMKDYRNTAWFKEVTEDYNDLDKYGKYMGDNFFSAEDLRDYRFWQLMKESGAYRNLDGKAVDDIASYNFRKEVDEKLKAYDFSDKADAYNNAVGNISDHYDFDSLPEEEKKSIFTDVYGYNYEIVKKTKVNSPSFALLPILEPKVVASLRSKGAGFVSYTPGGEISLVPATVSDYKRALETYKVEKGSALSDSERKGIDEEIAKMNRLYEKSPANTLLSDKGTVYKDAEGKLYVAASTSVATGATSTTYASDAVIEVYPDGSAYCLPTGSGKFVKVVDKHPDGTPKAMQEWNVGPDGKLCTGDDVLLRHESVLALPEHASDYNSFISKVNSFGRHNPGEAVNVGGVAGFFGTTMAVSGQSAKAAASLNAPTCYDVMDPSDCQLLFGVCDPVMCPPSRFNLGGAWHVDDVVQTGLIGSLVLGLHNFGPTEPIPVCLTGVLAGLRNIKSILEGYVECLKTAQISGRSVGICDQIRSVYVCELLWNEVMSIFKIKGGLSTILNKFVAGESPGGGEYLTFQASLDNVGNSFNFFTKHYATSAFASYKSRSMDEFGGVVCKAAIFGKLPDFGNFVDEISTPEDPPQYTGFVTEMPFSETLGQSRYQVYYHIYAGKNAPVEYKVYLKNIAGETYGVTDKCERTSATRLEPGRYADQTIDCVDKKGYTQMCIMVNGKEECGFGKVTTEFALDYLGDLIVEDEVSRKITSEKDCVPEAPRTSPALGSLPLAGTSGLLSTGVRRVCAVNNPGAGTNPGNWKVVGTCGKNEQEVSLGSCWIDVSSVTVNDLERSAKIKEKLDEETLKAEKARLGITDFLGRKEAEEKLKEINGRKKDECKDFVQAYDDYQELVRRALHPQISGEAQLHAGEMLEELVKSDKKCVTKDEFREYKVLLTRFNAEADVLLKDFSVEVEKLAILRAEPFKFGNELDLKIVEYAKKLDTLMDNYQKEFGKLRKSLGDEGYEFYSGRLIERKSFYVGKLEKTSPEEVTTEARKEELKFDVAACRTCGEGAFFDTFDYCNEDDCLTLGNCYYVDTDGLGGDCTSCSEVVSCNQLEAEKFCNSKKCTGDAVGGKGLTCVWVPGINKCVEAREGKEEEVPEPSVTGTGLFAYEEKLDEIRNEVEENGCLSTAAMSSTIKSWKDALNRARGDTFEERTYKDILNEEVDANAYTKAVVAGVIAKESGFRPSAAGPTSDLGLGQFTNSTAPDTRLFVSCGEGRCERHCEAGDKCYLCDPKDGCRGLFAYDNREDPDVAIPAVLALLKLKDQELKASSCKAKYSSLDAQTRARILIATYNLGAGNTCAALNKAPGDAYDDFVKGIELAGIKTKGSTPAQFAEAHKCYARLIIYYAAALKDEFRGDTVVEETTPEETESLNRFTFAVISDSNAGEGSIEQGPKVPAAVNKVISLKPDLVIGLGDMIAGGTSTTNPTLINQMWDRYFEVVPNKIVAAGIKFFPAAGNHDASFNSVLPTIYDLRWGLYGLEHPFSGRYPRYYSFDYENNHFAIMDGSKVTISEDQLSWLEEDLKAAQGKYDHIFVFSHIQLKRLCTAPYCVGDLQPNDRLVKMFNDYNVDLFFNGHQQVYYKGNYRGVNVVSTGALRGPFILLGTTVNQKESFVVVDVNGKKVDVKAFTGAGFNSVFDESGFPGSVPGYTKFEEVGAGVS